MADTEDTQQGAAEAVSEDQKQQSDKKALSGLFQSLGIEAAREEDPVKGFDKAVETEVEDGEPVTPEPGDTQGGDETTDGDAAPKDGEGEEDGGKAKKSDDTPRPKRRSTSDKSMEEIKGAIRSLTDRLAKPDAPTKKQVEAATQDDPDKDLDPRDREVVELARFAAEQDESMKDLPAKQRGWLKDRTDFIVEYEKENGRGSFVKEGHNSDEWREWLDTNPPPVTREMIGKLTLQREVSKTREEMKSEFRKELEKRDRELKRFKLEPEIKRVSDESASAVLDLEGVDGADEIKDVYEAFAKNPEEAIKDYPFEAPVLASVTNDARKAVQTFLEVSSGLADHDDNDPGQRYVADFIIRQGENLDKLPEEQRMRNGKLMVSRQKMAQMRESGDDVSGYTTFTNDDVVQMIQTQAKNISVAMVKKRRLELDRAMKSRQPRESKAPDGQQSVPEKQRSPKAMSTRVPAKPAQPSKGDVPLFKKVMGMDKIVDKG